LRHEASIGARLKLRKLSKPVEREANVEKREGGMAGRKLFREKLETHGAGIVSDEQRR
jgi:hypothetical protein